jgi:hypothetical protein
MPVTAVRIGWLGAADGEDHAVLIAVALRTGARFCRLGQLKHQPTTSQGNPFNANPVTAVTSSNTTVRPGGAVSRNEDHAVLIAVALRTGARFCRLGQLKHQPDALLILWLAVTNPFNDARATAPQPARAIRSTPIR